MAPMKKKAWQNLLLLFFACSLTYLFLEAGYRFYLYHRFSQGGYSVLYVSRPNYIFDEQSGYRHRPNLDLLIQHYGRNNEYLLTIRQKTNNHGHVSRRDDVVARVPGEFRIAVIGDSFTDCANVNWPDALEEVLNQDGALKSRLHAATIKVINFGRSGIGVEQFAAINDHEIIAYQPDLVIVSLIADDIYRKFIWLADVNAGEFGATLIAGSLPARPENVDAAFSRVVIVDPAGSDNPEKREELRGQLSRKIIQRLRWFSPYPEVLAKIVQRMEWYSPQAVAKFLGSHVGLKPRLDITQGSPRYDNPEAAITAGAQALQRIAGKSKNILILLNPSPPDIYRELLEQKVPDDILRLEKRIAPLSIVNMGPYMGNRPDRQEIDKWYIYDSHFNDYGARVYAQAIHKYLGKYWSGRPAPQIH